MRQSPSQPNGNGALPLPESTPSTSENAPPPPPPPPPPANIHLSSRNLLANEMRDDETQFSSNFVSTCQTLQSGNSKLVPRPNHVGYGNMRSSIRFQSRGLNQGHFILNQDSFSTPQLFGPNPGYGVPQQNIPVDAPKNLTPAEWIAREMWMITMNEKNKPRRVNPKYDISRNCKCNNSRCIKLYCECFSSQMYCGESCECFRCYNNLDYEDTVEMAHERVAAEAESRAKGCSCKRSMCNKRYCGCFLAKVGCSKECQCKDCKNSFGVHEVQPIEKRPEKRSKLSEAKEHLISGSNRGSQIETTNDLRDSSPVVPISKIKDIPSQSHGNWESLSPNNTTIGISETETSVASLGILSNLNSSSGDKESITASNEGTSIDTSEMESYDTSNSWQNSKVIQEIGDVSLSVGGRTTVNTSELENYNSSSSSWSNSNTK